MRIDRLDRFHPKEEKDPETESKEKREDEIQKSPEYPEKKEISTAEAVVFAGLLGLKAYVIYDNKREKVKKAIDEAKQDFQTQPVAIKEIAAGLVMQLGSLALEYQREQQEQKLRIKQKVLSSLQKLATEKNQLDFLGDYETLQSEAIQESLRKPFEGVGMTEEEKVKLKVSMDPIAKAKQQAKSKVADFISSLIDSSRHK